MSSCFATTSLVYMSIDMETQAVRLGRLNGKGPLSVWPGIPLTSCSLTAGLLKFDTSKQDVSHKSSLAMTSVASGMVAGQMCHLWVRRVQMDGLKVDLRRLESMRLCNRKKTLVRGRLVRFRSKYSSLFLRFRCIFPAPSRHPRILRISRSPHRLLVHLRLHRATPGGEFRGGHKHTLCVIKITISFFLQLPICHTSVVYPDKAHGNLLSCHFYSNIRPFQTCLVCYFLGNQGSDILQ